MDLPFTASEFFGVFASYNRAVWPLPVLFNAAALLAIVALWRRWRGATRATLILLAALWLWMGVVYHWIFFRPINPAAAIFAALFVAQGLLLAAWGAQPRAQLRLSSDAAGVTGLLTMVYALVLYPVLGHALGHRFPASPTFGLPCPTTLFTIGVLLWARPRKPLPFAIPLVWAAIGSSAALRLGVYEDAGLAVAGAAAIIVLFRGRRAGPTVETLGTAPAGR